MVVLIGQIFRTKFDKRTRGPCLLLWQNAPIQGRIQRKPTWRHNFQPTDDYLSFFLPSLSLYTTTSPLTREMSPSPKKKTREREMRKEDISCARAFEFERISPSRVRHANRYSRRVCKALPKEKAKTSRTACSPSQAQPVFIKPKASRGVPLSPRGPFATNELPWCHWNLSHHFTCWPGGCRVVVLVRAFPPFRRPLGQAKTPTPFARHPQLTAVFV